MDRIVEQLSKLQELSTDELAELEEAALSEFETTQAAELSSESVAAMTTLADAVEAVRTEKARRAAEAQALADAAAEAAARVAPAEEAPETDVEEPEPATAEAADMPSTIPAKADDEEPEGTTPDNSAPAVPVDDDENKDDEELKKPAQFADEAPAEAELAVETPEAAEASTETPVEAEASVEAPAEAEAAVEETATAEAAVETAEEAAVETPAAAEASVESTDSDTEASVQADGELSIENNEVQEDNVTADASQGTGDLAIEAPAGRQPSIKPATTVSITAGADVPGISAGTKLDDSLAVADAFQKRLHSLRHVHGGDGEQHIVASYRSEFPASRELSANDPLENSNKIAQVTSQEAITAAAGICLPLETRYELGCDVGVTDRPVRDALARFGADRGGIRFFKAPTLGDSGGGSYENATGFWRGDANGANFATYGPDRTTATTPANQKPCLEVQCAAEETAYIEAITLCLTFNNLTTRTFPELIKRHNELALVAHARVAENALLAQLEAGSTQIAAPAQRVGAARELFNLLAAAVASYRFKHRLNAVQPLRMIAPVWVRDFVKADLALQMPGDGMDDTVGVADARIDAWFKSRGVNITWHLDGTGPATVDADGSGAGTDVNFAWPTTIEFALFAEGAWLYLDGGTLDLGVIRDSSLVATNEYKQFVETFEGVANVGCDSYWVSADLELCGSAAALAEVCSA